MDTELTTRQQAILTTVVEHYVATREPVSSGELARSYRENGKLLSSATIRNTLHELEEMGFLTKPHLSAGRVPSRSGFRFYVNQLVFTYHRLEAPEGMKHHLAQWERDISDTRDLLIRYLEFLQQETGHLSILLFPEPFSLPLHRLDFVRLSPRQVLVVLLSRGNLYRQVLVELDRDISYEELVAMANFINARARGRTLLELKRELIDQLRDRVEQMDRMARRVLDAAFGTVNRIESGGELMVRGMSHLFQVSDTGDLNRLRELVQTMEDKHRMVELIHACLDRDVTILLDSDIGPDCSVVVSPYGIGGGVKGAFGILGPVWMDYRRVLSTMKMLTESVMGTIIKRSIQ